MASTRKHPIAQHRYQVRYRDPSGRERSQNFAKKSEADKFAITVEADKLRGEWIDPRLGKIPFAEWSAQYEAGRVNLGRATRTRDETILRTLVLPSFGQLRLSAIQPVTVRQWVASLVEKGYAPATVRKGYQLFSSAIDAAVEDGLLPRTPCRGVKLPKMDRKEMRFLEAEETVALAEATEPRYQTLVLTAAYTGLRFGELAALKVSRLNMLKRSLRVIESVSDVGGQLRFGPVKSNASRRTVSLPPFLVDRLAAHLAAFPADSGLVFSMPKGGPLRRTTFRRRYWLPGVTASVGEPCRFHDLRHTHAALLIAGGVHPKVLQSRLGHASIRTTLDTYGHLFDGLDEAAADALDDVFRRSHVDKKRTGETPAVVGLHS